MTVYIDRRFFVLQVSAILLFFISCTKVELPVIDDPLEIEEIPNIGGQHYVSTDGSDSNPGTYEKPWATWHRAFEMASPGDTVYIRGGVYYATKTVWLDPVNGDAMNGTESKPIHFMNYPDEVPILDGSRKVNPSSGLILNGASHIYLKGLTVRNNYQIKDNYGFSSNFVLSKCTNITVENCNSYNSGRRGFFVYKGDEIYLLNCDSYNNCDSLDTSYRGGGGDGFLVWDDGTADDVGKKVVLRYCRAWNNSDDGYDIETEGLLVVDGCFAFNNGYLDGDGMGFKFGLKDMKTEGVTKVLTNCVSAYNKYSGFTTNDRNGMTNPMEVYNNTAYANGGSGFIIFETSDSDSRELQRIYRNNLSYKNGSSHRVMNDAKYTHSNNSWDHEVEMSDVDFLTLDSAGLQGERLEDGSLPYIDFLRLAEGSDLIDAGVDVGKDYHGIAPDLGAYEYK
jgi:pectate lyase-like protein